MLQELGFDVDAQTLGVGCAISAEDTQAYHPTTDEEPQRMIPSFVHMTHMTADRPYVPYKRMTHFIQHCVQVTGRNWSPELQPIVRRLKKAGVKVKDPMAYFRVRRLLKKWGFTSPHYRTIFALLKQMGGEVVAVPYKYEMALRQDFERLCAAFDESRSIHGRKNFLSYYLVVQLLLDKYKIRSFYKLPSIKDRVKFSSLVETYYTMTHRASAR